VKKLVCSALFLLFLLWRGGSAIADLVREVRGTKLDELRAALTLSEDARLRRELAIWAKKVDLPAGHYARLYDALREHVPDDGVIALVCKDQPLRRALTYTHLTVLLFPRRIHVMEELPNNWEQALPALGAHGYVLEYLAPPNPSVASSCDLVASSDDFRLWRFRGSGR
jgi:hypothetical protein